MNVLVVENEELDQMEVIALFKKFEQDNDIKINIIVEPIYEKALKIINNFVIALIDIELDNDVYNGIDLAKEIRKRNNDIRLIFISNYSYTSYLKSGYQARADSFMLKPLNQIEFNEEIKRITYDYIYKNQGFFNPKISTKKIYFKDILYIEMLQRKSIIHLSNNKEISCYYTLKKWMSIINNPSFSQPHRSFYVNLANIKKFSLHEIEMLNYYKIPITDAFRAKFQEDYFHFINLKE